MKSILSLISGLAPDFSSLGSSNVCNGGKHQHHHAKKGKVCFGDDVMKGIGSEEGRSRRQFDFFFWYFFLVLFYKFLANVRKASGKIAQRRGRGTQTHTHAHTFIYITDFLEMGIKLRFAERPALGPSGTSIFFVQTFSIIFDWFCRCRHIHTYYIFFDQYIIATTVN